MISEKVIVPMALLLLAWGSPCLDAVAGEPPAGSPVDASLALVIPSRPTNPMRAWYFDTTIVPYLAHGLRGPAWDQDAVNALSLASRAWTNDPDRADVWAIVETCRRAEGNGCVDPMVLYLHGHFQEWLGGTGVDWSHNYGGWFHGSRERDPEAQRVFSAAVTNVGKAGYPAFWRCRILQRAAHMGMDSSVRDISRKAEAWLKSALILYPEVLSDPQTPAQLLGELVVGGIDDVTEQSNSRNKGFAKIMPIVESSLTNQGRLALIKGHVYVAHAAEIRDSYNYSDRQKNDGANIEDLFKQAEAALTDAYQADPTSSCAAQLLIEVAAGLRQPPETMELWFKRAVTNDPDNLQAYVKKLLYLQSRWDGSPEPMLAYGHACLELVRTNPRLNPAIALQLFDAHAAVATVQGTWSNSYWLQPAVWTDVQAVYDVVLKREPNCAYDRSWFAELCCRCEQWPEAKRQFAILGKRVVPGPFETLDGLQRFQRKADLMTAALEAKP